MTLLIAAHVCHAAVLPSGSRFDPRNQIVSYNPNNTTIINSAVGYTTTLVFDEDETVISARTGFRRDGRLIKKITWYTWKFVLLNRLFRK